MGKDISGIQSTQIGAHWLPSYMLPGLPCFFTGSNAPDGDSGSWNRVSFTNVFSGLVVKNTTTSGGSALRVSNSDSGIEGTAYFVIDPGETVELKIRGKDLYLLADTLSGTVTYSVCAYMTSIYAKDYLSPTANFIVS